VLFRPRGGPLLLFYKMGSSPKLWSGMLARSVDGGQSWTPAERLPRGIYGPIRSKPVELADGTLVCPSSTELLGWRCRMEITRDRGRTWSRSPILNPLLSIRANQPTLLRHGERRLQALCRSKERRIAECWSQDGGRTWSRMGATALPNPNSGIEALTLADGRHLLLYNRSRTARTPLCLAVSQDGRAWRDLLELEDDPGEYSYPAAIQAGDGRVHMTYTWRRQRIRHVVLDRVPA
jgi:predicted neuraminidase